MQQSRGSTASSGVATYTYDNLYQLRSEHDTAPQTINDTYTYSIAGDPTKLAAVTQSFNAAHELCWTTTGAAPGAACTTPPSGASLYGYNTAGDRTTNAGATIAYDNRGLMTAAGGATYTYDPDGLRVAKTVAGATTNFVWDDSTAIALLLVDGTNRYVYGPDGTPIERLGNAKADTRWLGHDTQHSITLATDNSANVTTTNTYTPWGAVRAHTGETINLGYNAQYTDPETDFIYLRARYYDPGTAQFLTRDPIEPVTRSAYGYAANSPLNLTDPMGLAPWDGVVDFFTGGDCGDGFLDRAFGGVDELVWEHRDEIILVLALVGTASCPMCTVAFYASMGLSAVSTLHACNSGDRTSCALGVAALVTAGAGRALTRGAAPRLGAAADARLGASRWHLLQSNVTGPILRAGAIAARRTGFWSGWASDALSGVDVVNG